MELCLRTSRHALQTRAPSVAVTPDCCARHNCVSTTHPFLGKLCAHRNAWSGAEIWAAPRRNNPITSASLQRPKDHPHGKSPPPVRRVQADAQETLRRVQLSGETCRATLPSAAIQLPSPVVGPLSLKPPGS